VVVSVVVTGVGVRLGNNIQRKEVQIPNLPVGEGNGIFLTDRLVVRNRQDVTVLTTRIVRVLRTVLVFVMTFRVVRGQHGKPDSPPLVLPVASFALDGHTGQLCLDWRASSTVTRRSSPISGSLISTRGNNSTNASRAAFRDLTPRGQTFVVVLSEVRRIVLVMKTLFVLVRTGRLGGQQQFCGLSYLQPRQQVSAGVQNLGSERSSTGADAAGTKQYKANAATVTRTRRTRVRAFILIGVVHRWQCNSNFVERVCALIPANHSRTLAIMTNGPLSLKCVTPPAPKTRIERLKYRIIYSDRRLSSNRNLFSSIGEVGSSAPDCIVALAHRLNSLVALQPLGENSVRKKALASQSVKQIVVR